MPDACTWQSVGVEGVASGCILRPWDCSERPTHVLGAACSRHRGRASLVTNSTHTHTHTDSHSPRFRPWNLESDKFAWQLQKFASFAPQARIVQRIFRKNTHELLSSWSRNKDQVKMCPPAQALPLPRQGWGFALLGNAQGERDSNASIFLRRCSSRCACVARPTLPVSNRL